MKKNRFIQIRGSMGSGKTSIVRQWVEKGSFKVFFIDIYGKKYPYSYDAEQNMIITGRYDKKTVKCAGLDGVIENANVMREYLITLLKKNASTILFEAVMYGVTFKFSYELFNICKKFGYQYKAYALFPAFDVLLDRIYLRNNGKQIRIDRIINQYNKCMSSSQKLKEAGVDVDFIDTAIIPEKEMFAIVKELCNDKENC